jgi:hypothetical protein
LTCWGQAGGVAEFVLDDRKVERAMHSLPGDAVTHEHPTGDARCVPSSVIVPHQSASDIRDISRGSFFISSEWIIAVVLACRRCHPSSFDEDLDITEVAWNQKCHDLALAIGQDL